MDYFEKKQLIRIAICAVLVGVIVLAMTGVFGGSEPMIYDPSAKNIPAGATTAEATEQGFGGNVTASVSVTDGKIQALFIDTPDETEGLGKRVSEAEFTNQFIGKDGLFAFGEDGIEALSGATVTSTAALKAINRAYTIAVTGEEPAKAEPEKTEAEPEKADEAVPETEEKPVEAEKTETTGEAANATEQGFGGEVTVHVTLDGDKVQVLTIDTPDETAGLGQRASEEAFTGQFIGKSAPFTFGEDGIEALTGATVTSNAALKAINRAIGAETEAPAEEKTEEPAEKAAEAPVAQDEQKTETAADGQAYGVYRVTKENAFSKVTVIASAKNGKLTDVQITSEGEEGKDLLTDEIRSEWAKAILESGSAAPDAITGATLTFSAGSVQEAMTEILARMSGEEAETSAEEKASAAEEKPEEEPSEEQAEEPAETETEPEAGIMEAAEQGFGGDVTVHVTLDGDKIGTLTIDTPNETAGLGQRASETAFTDQFIGKSGPFAFGEDGIEALSGATVTSNAALKAINRAIGAEAETPTEEKPAEEPAEEPAEAPGVQAEEKAETGSNGQAYGVYRVTKENTFSKVTVTASVKNGKLTDVKITSEGEEGKDLLTDAIRSEWAKAILESGSAAPDAVTGATLTYSAGSVQEAMTEILARISGEAAETPAAEKTPEAEEKPAEEPAPEQPSEKSSDSAGDILSAIVVSMGRESENSYVTDYLEQDPYLVNIYEGYGFAKDYSSARGHYYTLTDVDKTQRPHAKANCLTCKTPDMHKMIEEQGVGVYSMPFDEVMAQMTQPIGCYTCHGADDGNGGRMVVTHQYVNEALGENVSEVKAASLSCGQCHIEYYFTPEDSETMMPYHSKAEMTPEAILAYYDNLGFSDWEQPGTGTKMLKAQHPELETYLYGKHAAMLSCADCHMPVETTESGAEYHDHHLVSPLASETLLAKCAACHGSAENTTALVKGIQEKVTARETEVGNKLSGLKDALAAAVSAGKMSEEELDAVRKLHREAQWFFDFCYVENSEGAHNSELAIRCLDTSEAKIDEAMGLLNAAGTADSTAATQESSAEEPAA